MYDQEGTCTDTFPVQAPVVQRVNSAINWVYHYPANTVSAIKINNCIIPWIVLSILWTTGTRTVLNNI